MVETLAFQDYQYETKEVKKLNDGSVQLPFTKEISRGKVDFDFRIKKDKEGRFFIENKTENTPQNKGYVFNKDKRYLLDTSSSLAFAKSLGKALDSYIGEGRPSLAQEKWEKAYSLLWSKFDLQLKNEQLNTFKEEREALQHSIEREKANLLSDKAFEWNKKEQRLKFYYELGSSHSVVLSLQKGKQGEIILSMDTMGRLLWSNFIKKSFPKAKIAEIPQFIESTLRNGQKLTTYGNIPINNDYRPPEKLLRKCREKADKAIRIFQLRENEK